MTCCWVQSHYLGFPPTRSHIVNLYSCSPEETAAVVCFLSSLEGLKPVTPAQKAAATLDIIVSVLWCPRNYDECTRDEDGALPRHLPLNIP